MREIHQLRDVQSWMDSGMKLSTACNETAKLYDAAVSQLAGWYDNKQLDGLESTLKKMMEADPQFIAGRSLKHSLEVIGGSNIKNNPTLEKNIERLASDVESNSNTCGEWEKLHVKALQFSSMGNAEAAVRQWEEILIEYPSDILSLHLAGMTCLINGTMEKVSGISGRILPSFEDEHSLSSIHAWHSFGLSEINLLPQAERHARIGISLEPKNGFSTHAMAHVFEMTSRYDDGIAYMNDNETLWNFSNHIAGHNYWHWSLYYLTKGEFESAADVLDQKLLNRPDFGRFDSLTLSYLLAMEDYSISDVMQKHGDRYEDIIKQNQANHYRSFNDVRIMMGLCVSKKYDEAEQFMTESKGSECIHGRNVNENLLTSIWSYSREMYEDCVELLWPIRYNIKQIGGSEAQRDVFSLMLIHACLRSKKVKHNRLASQLIEEREIHRMKSPLVDRLRRLL
ncbi:tetratricopeptide repeat protein 38-like [Bradysia coprophila]|uniref:tetratricopeptide repeat protein 38-like n=1 Tax=Bradysia coprophila TaxID=38358 RepID=UPI00187DA248|nr:tetratricopeptide repeat protein 38-like [Bradysia coprophila]